ncbi:MAG TPA: ABC transporter permease [Dehalococcoidia bacterium]|nr:ABC transporter permease [Dehalococcoidia bacterium]
MTIDAVRIQGGEAAETAALPAGSRFWRRLRRNRPALAGLAVLLVLALIALCAPLLAPHAPNAQDCTAGSLIGPGGDHPLGTDETCRDVLSRLMFGARVSLLVGLLAPLVALAIALPVGALAALSSRFLDNLLMRTTDLAFAFPDLLLFILLRQVLLDTAVPGGSIAVVVLAVSLVSWTTLARLVRGQLLQLKRQDFVLAAQALGASRRRIVLLHMLPNCLGPLLVALAFAVPQAILAESALSFLGLGVLPPQATWGAMVNSGYSAIYTQPWLVVYPALAIALTMLAVTLLADGLRNALDPRSQS